MRPEKITLLEETKARLEAADYTFIFNYGGLQVVQLTELRKSLKPLNASATVIKNSFIDRLARELGWEDVSSILAGPTAIVTGTGDASEVAKLLVKFVKTYDKAAVKGACLDGKVLDTADVSALSQLPPREVMLGKFVGTLAAPMSGLVGVFHQKLSSLLYVLKAVEDKKKSQAA
jgi:large subunit ribosomal protein L10